MKMKNVVGFCATAIAFAGFVQAQDLRHVKFSGTINDYSPSTVSGGPWEIRGEWSLDVLGTASFSAAFTMGFRIALRWIPRTPRPEVLTVTIFR